MIYINDFSESSKVLSFLLFADDTNLFCRHKDINILKYTANQELCKVVNWLGANKLSLNVSKTQFIIFQAKNKKIHHNLQVQMNDQRIEQVNNTKFLGLIIDKDLSWKYHINQVTLKISKMSGILVRARNYLSLRTLDTIYNALIYPYLTYCNTLCASTYSSRLKNIYKVQKKIVRYMTFSKYRQESRTLFL